MAAEKGHECVLVLVKALPHVGEKHGETVCCAGVTEDRQWRRQFPVPFRYLENQKFSRWQWIEYDWRKPKDDKRPESQSVQEGNIRPGKTMLVKERAGFLAPLVFGSTTEAAERGDTLTLVRPRDSVFSFKKKSAKDLEKERRGYHAAAAQLSFLTQQQEPLTPCSYEFRFKYRTDDGPHDHACGEWETAAMYDKFARRYGEKNGLRKMEDVFNFEYPEKGMVFALGTHSRVPSRWLLVGILRLDEVDQLNLPCLSGYHPHPLYVVCTHFPE